MKKIAALIFAALSATSQLRADVQVRAVQEQLKEQGFYYGEVDGEPGAETSAAVRRYQIRNGLQVTGTLTQETLDALHVGGTTAPANTVPKPVPASPKNIPQKQSAPAPSMDESDRDYLRNQESAPVNPPPVRTPGTLPPPVEITRQPSYLSAQYARLFARTPYENAPTEVQQRTLRDAQLRLLRERLYNGPVDGIPGPATERAISFYQDDTGLPRTGRLDLDTLARMGLLPNTHRQVIIEPFYPQPYVRPVEPPRVYRGIWVH